MAFANREENQQLPPKVTNAGRATFAQNVNVLMNSYQLDIKQMVPQVFQYELRFIGERIFTRKDNQPEKKLQDLATGPRNDVSKETRRRLLWLLFQQLITQHADFSGTEKRNFTFDCALLLFSVKPLITDKKQRKFPMNVNRASLEDRCRDYISRNETITATLTPTGIVNLRDAPAAYIRGDRSVVQFLELLSSQRIYEQGGHYCFGNRMYEKDSVIQLQGDPRILKSGLQKNVRFVGENVQNAQPILQIDPKKSAFQPSIELLHFLCAFCGINPQNPQQLEQNIGNYFERIRKQTKGLVLATTHLRDNQVLFSATDLTQMPARDITFERQGVQVSVPDHYQQTYQMRLHFPGLPCVIHRKPGAPGQNRPNDSYYPIEILHILPGQRVPIDKQTPKLTEQMIRQCQVLPADLPAQIDQQRDAAMVQSGNPFFKQHGLRVDANQMRLEAQVLFPPAIQYNPPQDRVEPDRTGKLEWRTVGRDVPQQRAYTAPAAWPTRWAVVIVQNCVTMQQCEQFCKQLVNIARSRGIGDAGLPPRVDHFEDTTTEFVRDKFEFYRNHKCTFVLAFAPGKRDAYPGDIHHTLKYCEQQFDVLTLHISPEIMGKGSGGGGGAIMVLENILMKLNLKLGGANWNLVTPVAYKQAARNQADIFGDVWLNGNKRMFIGIDFSHAPPQTIFERQAGKTPSIPSIVGMAYTVDKFMLRMRGTYWCQQTRQTTMVAAHQRPFVEHLKEAISLYMATNNAWPEHLIVFRAGISEGEFQRISFWEGQAFCKAFEHLAARGGNFQPPAVTILVCQRRSNYRMIPTNINRQAKAPDQNVQPGTVLDKGAMSAACTDFLLIPHKALQGTAQPTRCTVVHEWRPETGPAARIPPQLPVEELENITNSLCYSHGICAMPTAVPGVLYAGEELAKRGRNNWKMHTADGRQVPHFDLPPLGQEGDAALQAQLQLDKQRAEHNAHVSGELNPTVPTKFWA